MTIAESLFDSAPVDTPAAGRLAGRRWARPARLVGGAAYAALFVQQYRTKGFPFDRERVLLWIVGALLITCIGRPWRRGARVLVDWFPFAVLVYAYDYTQSVASDLGVPVVVRPVVAVERALFFGGEPSVWLQQHLMPADDAPAAWWELGVSIVYASHFVVPFALAGFLWWRSRDHWKRWVLRFMTLSLTACATFALLPTGPPWYAAEQGLIDALARPAGRGWARIGLYAAPNLLEWGRDHANPFAAIPSLHAGYAMLVAAFLFRLAGRGRARWLLFAYPVAMAFTLVYAGEHYVIDILIGWLYVAGSLALATRLERAWRSRRSARAPGVTATTG